jgi:raffinose/stachyose/melibiose transport system substrate-binding protein
LKAIALMVCLSLLLSACSGITGSSSQELTTTQKTTITLYVDYSQSYIVDLMRRIIGNFPQYKFDIQYMPDNITTSELEEELKHNDTPDVIISSNLSPDMEGLETGMADLSAKSYCSEYKPAYLNDVEKDGKIYFLPLVSVVDGIVYNKTLFDENGWSVPKNYEEYVALCKSIIAAGYGVEGNTFATTEMNTKASTVFKRSYMLNVGRQLSAYKWLTDFNDRKASISDIDWMTVLNDLDTTSALRKESKLYDKTNGTYFDIAAQIANRNYATVESSTVVVVQGGAAEKHDQYRMMPFYGSNSDGGWLFNRGYTKFGASAAAMKDPDKAKAIDAFFSYLSSDEGQTLINQYTYNIIAPTEGGTPQTGSDFFADVQSELSQGRILEYDSMTNCESILDECVYAYLNGAMTREQLMATLEKTNKDGDGSDTFLASAAQDFSRDDMKSLLLTALRDETGADFSLLYEDVADMHIGNMPVSRRYLSSRFYQGDITEHDLSRCIQASHYENYDPACKASTLLQYTMTGQQILDLLEYNKNLYLGGGLTMTYTWNADMNTYLATGFTADNGKAFDLNAEYTVASISLIPMDSGSYTSVKDTGIGYYKAVRQWLVNQKTVTPTALNEPEFKGNNGIFGLFSN